MKRTISLILTVLLLLIFQLPAFASGETPVEITLGDVYDLTSLTLTLESADESKIEAKFNEKDNFTTTLTLPAGEYKVSDYSYVSTDDSQYDMDIVGTTFTVPEASTPIKIKLITGQDAKDYTLLDTLKDSKTEFVVLIICGTVYLFVTKKEKQKKKTTNPKLTKMMEEHETKQEFYRNDKIDYAQFTRVEQTNEQTTTEEDTE